MRPTRGPLSRIAHRHSAPRALSAALACAGILAASVAVAPAQDTGTLNSKIAAARGQAGALAAAVQAKQNALSGALARAQAAAAREARVAGMLAQGQARAGVLETRVGETRTRVRQERLRLWRAKRALAARLVSMYKSGMPDVISVVLQADGFDDMLSRARYLEAIERADSRMVGRIREIRNALTIDLAELRRLESRQRAFNGRLASARASIAAVRARAGAEAAALDRARTAQRAALASLQSRISGWVGQVQRLESLNRQQAYRYVGQWVGDYAIPRAVVMCESGGNPRAVNPGSGAGGLYQIMPSTWRGLGYKGRPQDAPKRRQDEAASRLWAGGRGAGNWSCAR